MSSILYVAFMLNKEEYGIEISYAQEIIRIPNQITPIPNMPSFIEGVINLRGKVLPVIDLKKRFHFQQTNKDLDSRLLIVDFEHTLLAIIVDDVSEIITINEQTIEKTNSVMSQIGNDSLKGIGIVDNRLILLLDVLKLKTEVFQLSLEMEEKI